MSGVWLCRRRCRVVVFARRCVNQVCVYCQLADKKKKLLLHIYSQAKTHSATGISVAFDAMSLLNDNSPVVSSSPSTLKPYSTVSTGKTNTTAVKMDKNDPVIPVAIANQQETATAVLTQKTDIGRYLE